MAKWMLGGLYCIVATIEDVPIYISLFQYPKAGLGGIEFYRQWRIYRTAVLLFV
jgi:hypothetical protein